MILMRAGRNDAALPLLQAAIRHNPGLAAAQNNLGVIYAQQGKLDMAILQFQQALTIDPHYEDARGNLSKMLQERSQKAIRQN